MAGDIKSKSTTGNDRQVLQLLSAAKSGMPFLLCATLIIGNISCPLAGLAKGRSGGGHHESGGKGDKHGDKGKDKGTEHGKSDKKAAKDDSPADSNHRRAGGRQSNNVSHSGNVNARNANAHNTTVNNVNANSANVNRASVNNANYHQTNVVVPAGSSGPNVNINHTTVVAPPANNTYRYWSNGQWVPASSLGNQSPLYQHWNGSSWVRVSK